MNPSGMRMEEKKLDDSMSHGNISYKSTHSSRSSVLERAREYNRRIEHRSKSLERKSASSPSTPRSQSVDARQRSTHRSTRERAMASVRHDSQHKTTTTPQQQASPASPPTRRSRHSGEAQSKRSPAQQPQQQQQQDAGAAVVTPELLVDALSGHEDGLLAIAERLMEHYDQGYDVMGEAIIDAFADVQKLFQHVVEAAHMEGAAFEASRRDKEVQELRHAAADGVLEPEPQQPDLGTPTGPTRHDEFIDQDVKDVLTQAIRQGTVLRDANKHNECHALYEQACQSASALLPVDSDHRGRLQLSLARAESMGHDRACAILRYAMDDVLRSGLRAHSTPLPDPSKRADVVLQRSNARTGNVVLQSANEALSSLQEELKEIMSAPVYKDTPLQDVAQRFWAALREAQKGQEKNEERLEQNLGKLKGDFLLARADYEERLVQSQQVAERYRIKYERLKNQVDTSASTGEEYMEQARSFAKTLSESKTHDSTDMYGSVKSSATRGAGSVASLGSGLAQHAKTIVNQMKDFNCNAPTSDRNADLEDMPYQGRDRRPRNVSSSASKAGSSRASPLRRFDQASQQQQQRSRSASSRNKPSRSYREYSRSPQRVDV